jgi:putative DNA primase/helicase
MIGVEFSTIPPFLMQLPRWLMWAEAERNGRKTKIPLTAAGRAAKSTDRTTWCDFPTALGVLRLKVANFNGIGIALGQLDGPAGELLGGMDFDSCLDADGNLAAWTAPIVAILNTYIEISPSGTGLKAFFRSSVADIDALRAAFAIAPTKFGTKKSVPAAANGQEHGPAIEVYLGHGRFFCITGHRWPRGDDSATADVQLLDLPALLAIAALVRQATGTKDKTKPGKKGRGRDTSRSALAFRMGMQLYREGKSFDEMCAALRAHPDTAEWCKEKGDADNGRELLRLWEAAEQAARGRDTFIRIVPGELDRLADEAEAAIIAAGADVFQRGLLTRPAITELPAADKGRTHAALLHAMSPYELMDTFCATAQWLRWAPKQGGWVAADPPHAVATILHHRVGRWNVPPCRGVLMTPTLRPDGSLLKKPGYDPDTAYYLWLPPDLDMPAISDKPERSECEAALKFIEAPLEEFPFVEARDHSVAVSAIITAVVRAALLVAPIHAASSPVAGTGKSYLWDIVAAVALGDRCPVLFAGSGKEELEKKLNGLLLAGASLFSMDNLDQPLAGDLLCQVAERPLLDLRRLGKSDPIRSLNGSLGLATGNNLPVHSDLARRVLMAMLDRGVERPELHRFTGNPMRQVLTERGYYIAAALTLVRGYLADPTAPGVSPLASYEDYSRFVRGPLLWLGRADPAAALVGERGTDPIRSELLEFMTAWEACIGCNTTITAAEIAGNATDGPRMPDRKAHAAGAAWDAAYAAWQDEGVKWKTFAPIVHATCGAHGHATSRDIGDWLRRNKNTVAAGKKFTSKTGHGGLAQWWLETNNNPQGAPTP